MTTTGFETFVTNLVAKGDANKASALKALFVAFGNTPQQFSHSTVNNTLTTI